MMYPYRVYIVDEDMHPKGVVSMTDILREIIPNAVDSVFSYL